MEPLTATILAALTKLTEPAIKDSYEALKSIIRRKFSNVARGLDEVEKDSISEERKLELNKAVTEAKASEDPDTQQAVAMLAAEIEKKSKANVINNQNIGGTGNYVTGSGSMHFQK